MEIKEPNSCRGNTNIRYNTFNRCDELLFILHPVPAMLHLNHLEIIALLYHHPGLVCGYFATKCATELEPNG